MNDKTLSNITVLDLTRILAGPYCSMMFADFGANVIKIEKPGVGDDSRIHYPVINGESAYYMNLNRNKKGITLDLKSPEGKEIFKKMVAKADIVLENYRPGVMDRLGLGYEELKKINPAIVYGAVSGFGQYGPYSQRPGYDIIGQAMGGLMSTTGWPDSPPTRSGTAISDVMGGISLCVGVLMAYIHARETGIGQMVDVSLVDSTVSALEIINQIYLNTGRVPTRIGNAYEAAFPYDSFLAKDGYFVLAAGNQKLFKIVIDTIGKPELIENEKFATNVLRVEHRDELKPLLQEWFIDKEVDYLVNLFLEKGVPAAPILSIDKVAENEHIAKARQMFLQMNHPKAGPIMITGNQIKLSETPATFDVPAPTLGQDTKEVLQEMLGITDEEYYELRAKNIF